MKLTRPSLNKCCQLQTSWGEDDFFPISKYESWNTKSTNSWATICESLSFGVPCWVEQPAFFMFLQQHPESWWKLLSSQMVSSVEQQSLKGSFHRAFGTRREGRLAAKDFKFIRLDLFLRSSSKNDMFDFLKTKKTFSSVANFISFYNILLLLCIQSKTIILFLHLHKLVLSCFACLGNII